MRSFSADWDILQPEEVLTNGDIAISNPGKYFTKTDLNITSVIPFIGARYRRKQPIFLSQ
jgi:hypothetical protein